MGWFPLSLSAMATQLCNKFISAPAFVGLAQVAEWNGFAFWESTAVPLAMIGIVIIVPPLYRANIVVFMNLSKDASLHPHRLF
jgi:hypothetical protein